MHRRDFIKTSAVIGGGTYIIGPSALAVKDMPPGNAFDRSMRWAQLAFVENDPANYDPDWWLAYFKRIHADGVLLSAGGVAAFYPTKIPLHHRSNWLGNTDPLGYMINGCRKMNMSVVLRTDPHAARQDVYDAHPDWIAVTPKGEKQRHWANPALWVTCCLGPYNFEFMTAVHKEIMDMYQPDGIFSNRWSGPWAFTGICYCEHCTKNFKDFSGMDLPRSNKLFDESTRLDPVYIQYRKWSTERLRELWLLWDKVIRQSKPSARFIPNGFPDKLVIGEQSDIVLSDMQFRSGPFPPWANGKSAKELRAVMGMKPLVNIFSIAASGPNRWMDSVQTEAELRIWAAEGVANGMRPCVVKFGAVPNDKRWVPVIEKMYNAYYRNERYLRNVAPIANVGLITYESHFSGAAEKPWQQDAGEHAMGMYHALVERRIPFEIVNPGLLDAQHLSAFKLLILSDVTSLSDKQCEQLRQFVARGGSLLATFETSLYDENNQLRKNFGLSDLFGVHYDQGVEGPMKNSYLRLKGTHPVLKGLENANRIINGYFRLKVTPVEDFPSPVTLIPSYPDLPMEDVYTRVPETDIRELYLREIGSSRIAYIPWDIERSFWKQQTPDHGMLLGNIIEWTLNEAPLVKVDAPGVIDVNLWKQENAMTVHLVNLTNPMMMKPPFRELIPVAATVHVRLPAGAKVKAVHLLMNESVAEYTVAEGMVRVSIPQILDHEIIALDLVS